MQNLNLWLHAKQIVRFPRTEQPPRSVILPPIRRVEPHGKVVIYTQPMIDDYLSC